MQLLRTEWSLKRLAVCFKSRDESGLQRRWSAIADASGIHTTVNNPVYHRPRDECGGGSAWAAGFIDHIAQDVYRDDGSSAVVDNSVDVHESSLARTLRHADLSAAMCQETIGDHSHVTRAELEAVENPNSGKPLQLSDALRRSSDVDSTLATLKTCGVLAILRAKNADAAISRGLELVELGCKAIEVRSLQIRLAFMCSCFVLQVTVDSTDWRRVLKTLVEQLPPHVCIGVGTVMDDTVSCLEEIAALGAKFALSPINPLGFIDECNRVGILAVPSGLSSNELWDLHRQGVKMIKLFHAGQVQSQSPNYD